MLEAAKLLLEIQSNLLDLVLPANFDITFELLRLVPEIDMLLPLLRL